MDGLELGVATLGINISLETKQLRPWAANVPEDVYNEYVVTYAHVNEVSEFMGKTFQAAKLIH